MRAIWIGIDSTPTGTRILATAGPTETILKARLPAAVQHPRAVPTLLEALALWVGGTVRAAIVAGDAPCSSATRLKLDSLIDGAGAPHYHVEFVDGQRPKPRHRDALDGLGRFHDLRQLLLFEVAR